MVQLIGYLEMSERLKILWFHLNFGKPRLKMLEEVLGMEREVGMVFWMRRMEMVG